MKLTLLSAFIFSSSTMVMAAFKATVFCPTPQGLKACADTLVTRGKIVLNTATGNTLAADLSSTTLSCVYFTSMFKGTTRCVYQNCIISSCSN